MGSGFKLDPSAFWDVIWGAVSLLLTFELWSYGFGQLIKAADAVAKTTRQRGTGASLTEAF